MSKNKNNQINKKNSETIKALVNLMNDIDQKYSIRVGIIGSQAYEKHPDSDLTNAELGAIHEFGCTINVTEKMRRFFYAKWGIQKSNNPVVIPARSFLRMPLLRGDFNEYLLAKIRKEGLLLVDADSLGRDKESRQLTRELNVNNAQQAITQEGGIIERIANIVAAEALWLVDNAFSSGGFGKWPPISEITKQSRKNDPSSPPLTDGGYLRGSISAEVKRV